MTPEKRLGITKWLLHQGHIRLALRMAIRNTQHAELKKLARTWFLLALVRDLQGNQEAYDAAVAAARACSDYAQEGEVDLHHDKVLLVLRRSSPELAQRKLDHIRKVAALSEPNHIARLLSIEGSIYFFRGAFESARQCQRKAHQIWDELEETANRPWASENYCRLMLVEIAITEDVRASARQRLKAICRSKKKHGWLIGRLGSYGGSKIRKLLLRRL